jgi:ketosteroid isomerase-like protein
MALTSLEVVDQFLEVSEDPTQFEKLIEVLDPQFRYYAGGTHLFSGFYGDTREAFFSRVAELEKRWPSDARVEIVAKWPVSDDLVVLHCRRTGTVDGETLDGGDYVWVLRVADGRIVEGVDLPGGRNNDFWTRHS